MSKIKFVREYERYGYTFYDVLYKSGMLKKYTHLNVPKTVKQYIECVKGVKQYDTFLKIDEVIYKEE